ncbi:MAG: type II toxin-antitoxin system VapC family toxin [Polaromonas sp.]
MKYLLNTDTLIYVFKRAGNCLAQLNRQNDTDIAISTINLFELEYGMGKSDNRIKMDSYVATLCRRYAVLDFDLAASQQAGVIRALLDTRGTPIGPYDIQMAGIALSKNLTIVTRNTREFVRVPGLQVENWYDQ